MTDNRSESTALATVERAPLRTIQPGSPVAAFVPTNFEEAVRIARAIAVSGMAPKSYGTDENKILVGMMTGAELGLTPMQSLRGVAVIGNMPKVWGDVALGLILSTNLVEDMVETTEGDFAVNGGNGVATCTIKRRGRPTPVMRRFSVDDARKAGLLTKDTYKGYTERMCQRRARDRAMSDLFADVLAGLNLATFEEEQAIEEGREPPTRAALETVAATVDDLHEQAGTQREEPKALPTEAAVVASETAERTANAAQTAAEELIAAEAARVAATPKPKPQRVRKPRERAETENAAAQPSDDEGNASTGRAAETATTHDATPAAASDASPESTSTGSEPVEKRQPRPVDHMDRATYRQLIEGYEAEGRADDQMCENARRALAKLEREVAFEPDPAEQHPPVGTDDEPEEAEFAEVDEEPSIYKPGGYDLNRDSGPAPAPSALDAALAHIKTLGDVPTLSAWLPDGWGSWSPDDQTEFASTKAQRIAALVAEARKR